MQYDFYSIYAMQFEQSGIHEFIFTMHCMHASMSIARGRRRAMLNAAVLYKPMGLMSL